MKTCTKCGLEKDESEFYRRDNRPSGTVSSCKKCCLERLNAWRKSADGQIAVERYRNSDKGRAAADRHNKGEKKLARVKEWRSSQEGKRSIRSTRLKRKYGITVADYERMLEEQEGCCKICRAVDPGRNQPFFNIDHDHVTLQTRGLLCHSCNTLLAQAKESPAILQAAIDYIAFYKGQS